MPGPGCRCVDLELLGVKSFRRGILVATLFFFTSPFYLLFAMERQDGAGLDPLHTGLSLLPYGVGLFVGPLASAPLLGRMRHRLLTIGLVVEASGYAATAAAVALQAGRWAVDRDSVRWRLRPGHRDAAAVQHGAWKTCRRVRAGSRREWLNSMLQIGSAISVAAVGTLFFAVLGSGTGPAAYAHAFGIAMIAVVAALAGAALLSRQ